MMNQMMKNDLSNISTSNNETEKLFFQNRDRKSMQA